MKKIIMIIMLVCMTSLLFAEDKIVAAYTVLPSALRGVWVEDEGEKFDDILFISSGSAIENQYGILHIVSVEKHEGDRGVMFVINTENKDIIFFIVIHPALPDTPLLSVYDKDKMLLTKMINIKQ